MSTEGDCILSIITCFFGCDRIPRGKEGALRMTTVECVEICLGKPILKNEPIRTSIINSTLRKCLGFKAPFEAFAEIFGVALEM